MKAIINDNQNNNIGIIVDDGSEKVPIKNKFGDEIGVFYFRPSDVGIIERYNKVAQDFDKITEPLESIDVNANGTAEDGNDTAAKVLAEAESRLFEACNYLFDGDMAGAFFGRMHPFSIINGHFYCENALNVVGKYISEKFDREMKQFNSRINKYTHGYKTGKHKGGKK